MFSGKNMEDVQYHILSKSIRILLKNTSPKEQRETVPNMFILCPSCSYILKKKWCCKNTVLGSDVRIDSKCIYWSAFIYIVREHNSRQGILLVSVDCKCTIRKVQIQDMAYLKVIAVDSQENKLPEISLERLTRPQYEIKFQSRAWKVSKPLPQMIEA
jgi:hypothetical protein